MRLGVLLLIPTRCSDHVGDPEPNKAPQSYKSDRYEVNPYQNPNWMHPSSSLHRTRLSKYCNRGHYLPTEQIKDGINRSPHDRGNETEDGHHRMIHKRPRDTGENHITDEERKPTNCPPLKTNRFPHLFPSSSRRARVAPEVVVAPFLFRNNHAIDDPHLRPGHLFLLCCCTLFHLPSSLGDQSGNRLV